MYSTWDLIAACVMTALTTTAVFTLPSALDRRKAHRTHTCTLPSPHNGPCKPHPGGPS